MKLIDLLVKELPRRGGWPEECDVVSTNGYGAVWAYKTKGCTSGRELYFHSSTEGHVTRAQYEAALAKNDGWIEWGGGECPVDSNAIVEVKCRWHNPHQYNNDRAGAFYWARTGSNADIIAYRLHNPDANSRAKDDRLEQDLNECISASEAQEWCGDWIPPIGCECEMQGSRGAWLPVVIIAKNDGFTFGWSYDYRIVLFGDKSDEFRPLSTEAEKAREAACRAISHILDEDRNFQFNSKKIYDAIAAGKIPGVKLED